MASHICLVRKSTSQETNSVRFAGFACAAAKTRSALHSIALSSGHRGDSDRHIRLAVARWPGGQSHLSSRKIYISENELCVCSAAKDWISFAFHFAILCSGHRGHSGHRFFRGLTGHRLFRGLKWTITCADRSATNIPQKSFGGGFVTHT